MVVRSAIAFVAGFASLLAPCVLPLVPGYLSVISDVEAGRLGQPGVARRIALSSIPFVLGFTVVFVALGAAAAATASVLDGDQREAVAGFILVLLGLLFLGVLPWAERIVAPELLSGARRRGSNALLGGAFAVCAAPCIGTVLGSVLVLAGDTETIVQGAFLLAVYSVGLGSAFVLAGVAFAKAMGAFRWLRDRYGVIRLVSGATLIGLGLLLFFGRWYWLQVAWNRFLNLFGLGVE